jgi:hypothetical protein
MKSKKEIYWENVHHRGNIRKMLWSLGLRPKRYVSHLENYLAYI